METEEREGSIEIELSRRAGNVEGSVRREQRPSIQLERERERERMKERQKREVVMWWW